MDKETRLRELRELGDVKTVKENVNNVKTDVDVVKYLDAQRRKATTIDEVDIIDLIMRCLFYAAPGEVQRSLEGKNKVTGRIHGERANIPDQEQPSEKTEQQAKSRAYHRDYMRKRRQKGSGG
jgi:hypothetical protein